MSTRANAWKMSKTFSAFSSGKVGKAFVHELARLFLAYAGSTLESVALTCAMTVPALLLQTPHQSSKAKEHVSCLQRRLKAWSEGKIDLLLHEGRTIQSHLPTKPWSAKPETELAQKFARLVFEGKIRPAIRLLTDHSRGGLLNLDSTVPDSSQSSEQRTVREDLLNKHPKGQDLKPSAVIELETDLQAPHPIIFEQIDGQLIHSIALRTQGAAGPSGIDASGWRRLLLSFQKESIDLCEAIAMMGRRICQNFVDPVGLTAFTSCRLIALDKCPGVRPIGIGEVVRRILGKAILTITSPDVQQVTGALQLCAGQHVGCEAAIHAMRQVFTQPNTEAVLLVDATNTFNCLNRKAALQNILLSFYCPSTGELLPRRRPPVCWRRRGDLLQ